MLVRVRPVVALELRQSSVAVLFWHIDGGTRPTKSHQLVVSVMGLRFGWCESPVHSEMSYIFDLFSIC